MNKYTPIMGLEVHVELKTKSKMFCRCSAAYFGQEPNTHVCPVCLGLPGALPVPNKKAIEWCIKIALALNCKINEFSKFDRKNYFYPDLPKGYQISQYDLPFGYNGSIELSNKKRVRVRRVHMEEDTGKLSHQDGVSLIDFNRSSVPLVEIVTEPDFHEAKDVVEYLQKLQRIVRYLDVSNADMEKGEMRLEPNISLTTDLKKLPAYKVEVKNINSFKFVDKAIAYELKRQEALLEAGETPAQETRGWHEQKQKTVSQRSKEDAQDYRYFPEPDIPPILFTKKQIGDLELSLPELEDEKKVRFAESYSLPNNDIAILTREKPLADYFEKTMRKNQELGIKNQGKIDAKSIANWIINKKIDYTKIAPEELLKQIASAKQTVTIDEKELEKIISQVLTENEKAVADYKQGKEAALMFLLGQVMKKLTVKADTKAILDSLRKALQ